MSVSSQTRGSTVEQLVWCERRIAELETQLAEMREILEEISLRFKSGNSVMVDRASINIDAINAWLKALAGEGE